MKIVIAPDSYKESLSALEVATAIESGFREILPTAEYVKLPVADGGEGTVEAMVAATCGRIVNVAVKGPLGEAVEGFFWLVWGEQGGPVLFKHFQPPKRAPTLVCLFFF